MPARSIRRCDTISASFGFSFRIGRKTRDNRISTPQEWAGSSSESGLLWKTQDRDLGKAAKPVDFFTFYRSAGRDQGAYLAGTSKSTSSAIFWKAVYASICI